VATKYVKAHANDTEDQAGRGKYKQTSDQLRVTNRNEVFAMSGTYVVAYDGTTQQKGKEMPRQCPGGVGGFAPV
jgi:hypothetical protein